MTQAQDAYVLADRKPSAIVVGVGAEQGLGAAVCRRFATQGYHVFVAGRTSGKIDKVAQTIAGAGGSAEAIVTNTTSERDVARLFEKAMAPRDSLNPVDLIAYNAGNNQRIDFRGMTAKQFEDFWRVGCFGGFLVGREAARRRVSAIPSHNWRTEYMRSTSLKIHRKRPVGLPPKRQLASKKLSPNKL